MLPWRDLLGDVPSGRTIDSSLLLLVRPRPDAPASAFTGDTEPTLLILSERVKLVLFGGVPAGGGTSAPSSPAAAAACGCA